MVVPQCCWRFPTKALVVINPNNPTGAVYSREVLEQIVELARKHQLLLLADEIYDKILYDGAMPHQPGYGGIGSAHS